MPVDAMFKCKEVTTRESFSSEAVAVSVKLEACIDGPGNEDWSKYTPAGEMTMTITNPAVEGFFVAGEDYRLSITKRQPQKARA